MQSRRRDTEGFEDTLFSVACCVTHVCPVCLIKTGSCPCSQLPADPVWGSAARSMTTFPLVEQKYCFPKEADHQGVCPQCFVNTGKDEVIICLLLC